MPMVRRVFVPIAAILLSLLAMNLQASPQQDVDELLAMEVPPAGVVFEVVSGDAEKLDEVLSRIHGWTQNLQERFDALPVVVISHGQEQFSLTSDALENNQALSETIAMIRRDDVPVMVCGNHASIRGVDVASYPDAIEVVKAAPAAVRELRARRYAVIVVTQ